MYLFKPKPRAAEGANPPSHDAADASPFERALPSVGAGSLQPGSAAEWAVGELLIRLCNGGRGLRREPPEAAE